MFGNLSIRQKLYGSSLIIVMALLLIGVISYSSIQETESLNKAATQLHASRADMLMLRRNEKDFIMRGLIKYKDKFSNNFDLLTGNIYDLEKTLSQQGIFLKEELRQLDEFFSRYSASFYDLIRISQTIGLTHEEGLRGALRKSVHAAESTIKLENNNQLLADMLMLRRNEKDFIMRSLPKYIDKHNKNYEKLLANLERSSIRAVNKKQIQMDMQAYQRDFKKLSDAFIERGLSPKEGVRGTMRASVHVTEALLTKINEAIESEIQAQKETNIAVLIITCSVLLVMIAFILFYIAQNISIRLFLINQKMSEISEGDADLTSKLKFSGEDEISELATNFNKITEKLRRLVTKVSSISGELSTNSQNLSDDALATAEYASEQSKEANTVVSSMNEVFASSEEIYANITSAAEAANQARIETLEGEKVVKKAETTIRLLAEELQASSENVSILEKDSNGIGQVLEVIRGIAEQTNLLALNAAIEAARAGETGRGFAVVADEVRTLAQRTQDATSEINELIERLQSGVKSIIQTIQNGMTEAESSASDVNKAKDSFTSITGSVQNIFEMSNQISTTSEHQTALTQQVNDGVVHISERSKETLKNVESTRENSAELAQHAIILESMVGNYKV